MQLNPWMAIGLNALYAILTGLTVPVIDSLGFTGHDAQIVAWAGILAVPLNMVLHAYSSNQPGPLAPVNPPVVQAATALAALPAGAPASAVRDAKATATAAVAEHQP
jgi:hypothetical protein